MAPPRQQTRPYYSKFFWKEWEAKTQDLDPYEFTAYMRLLSYAKLNSPDFCSLPNEHRRLAIITRLGFQRWRRVADKVLAFFRLTETNRWVHERLQEEAAEWTQVGVNQRLRRTGGQPDDNRSATGGGSKSEVRSQKSEESKKNLTLVRPRSARPEVEGFQEWYDSYPRHVARKAAHKAYITALREVSREVLLSGARSYASQVVGREPDKIKHPSTWLNGGCWADEASSEGVETQSDSLQARIQAKIKEMEDAKVH